MVYRAGDAVASPHGDLIVRKSGGAARSSFDATEQALWTSTPYQADYWCDITNGVYRSNGDAVTPSTLLTHNTPGSPGFVEVAPGFTNSVSTFSGYANGVIGSGGVLPIGWTSANTGVAKTLIYANEVAVEYTMSVGSGASAGLRSPAYSGVNSGNWEVSFYLDMSGVDTEKLKFYVAWSSNSKGLTLISGNAYAQGRGRLTVTLPPSDSASDSVLFMVQNPTGGAIAVDVLTANIVVAPSVSVLLRDANPLITGTQSARTATLNVPNGSYTLFAWTDRGIVSANANASGGTGINLRTALGSAKIYKIAAWVAGRYVTGTVNDASRYSPVKSVDLAALAQMHTKTVGYSQMYLHGPNQDWSTQKSKAYWNRDRTEVRPGDRAVTDADSYKRRAEVVSMLPMPYDQDVWLSLPFRIQGSLNLPGAWGIMWQWRYTDQAGDTLSLSPEFSLMMSLGNALRVEVRSSTNSNPATNPTATVPWTGNYVPGQWHRFVARIQFSRTGGGKLGMWLDGQEVFAFQNYAIGYNKTNGPQAHWGFYGVQSDDVIVIERANVEFGTDDLSSRITNPLPI